MQCNDNIAAGSIFNNLIQSFDREEVDPRASTNPLLGIFLSGSGRAGEGIHLQIATNGQECSESAQQSIESEEASIFRAPVGF